MEAFVDMITNLGFKVIPFSFAFYLPVRWLEYIWNRGYNRLVKGIWYFALGMVYLTKGMGSDLIVMYICFIEACDLTFQQLEINRERNKSRKNQTKTTLSN